MRKINNLPKIDIFLQLGIILMAIKTLCSQSKVIYYNDYLDTFLSIMSAVSFTMVIIRQKYSLKLLVLYGCIAVLGIINIYLTGDFTLFITIMTCLVITNEEFDNIIKHIYFYQMLFFLIHCFIAAISIILTGDNLSSVIGGVTRYQFGFVHPNTFSIYFFQLALLWSWIHFSSLKHKNIFKIFALSFVVFLFTKTRTLLISTCILCILLEISKSQKKQVINLLNILAKYVAIMCTVFILIMTFNYKLNNPVILKIDDLLTGRIKLGAYAYETLGITWLGQAGIESVHWDQFWRLNSHTYDCVYTYFAMEKGIIWLVILCACFFELSKKRNKKINIFLIVWSLYAVTEVHPIYCYQCFPILLISQLLPSSEDKQN